MVFGSREAYPVEVSGWDCNHNFLGEKTELHGSELAGNTFCCDEKSLLGIGRTSLYRYSKDGCYDQALIVRAKAAGIS